MLNLINRIIRNANKHYELNYRFSIKVLEALSTRTWLKENERVALQNAFDRKASQADCAVLIHALRYDLYLSKLEGTEFSAVAK